LQRRAGLLNGLLLRSAFEFHLARHWPLATRTELRTRLVNAAQISTPWARASALRWIGLSLAPLVRLRPMGLYAVAPCADGGPTMGPTDLLIKCCCAMVNKVLTRM